MSTKPKILKFITSNSGKVREAQTALEPLGYQVEQLEIPYPEIQTSNLEEVVKFGTRWVTMGLLNILKESDWAVIIEDSGLFVHALNNFPGVYSKFVFETLGYDGILRLLKNAEDRTAHFMSCIGYAEPKGQERIFIGKCDGTISTTPKGSGGFGYDPIFIPEDESKTFAEFAELDIAQKNRYSHRGKALEQLIEFLSK